LDGIDDPFMARFSTPCPNVFLSRRFLSAVEAQILHPDERLVLIGVTDDLAMPFALFAFVQRHRLGAKVIEGLDFGVTDYFAPCMASGVAPDPGEAKRLWAEILRVLPPADAITFKKMPRMLYGQPHALSNADFVRPMATSATTLSLRSEEGGVIDEPTSLAR